MKINYNYTREQKKRMVKAIGEALDEKPVYLGVPSCAYKIAEFTVTRDGSLEFPDDTDMGRDYARVFRYGGSGTDQPVQSGN